MATDRPPYGGTPHVDAETSRAAAEAMAASAAQLREQIYLQITAFGYHGATCDELEERFGYRHQTCSARIRELALEFRIVPAMTAEGEIITRPTRSNRQARVWLSATLVPGSLYDPQSTNIGSEGARKLPLAAVRAFYQATGFSPRFLPEERVRAGLHAFLVEMRGAAADPVDYGQRPPAPPAPPQAPPRSPPPPPPPAPALNIPDHLRVPSTPPAPPTADWSDL